MIEPTWIKKTLDELTDAGWPIPTELESLARAAREGDDRAGRLPDELALDAEWGRS